MKTIDSNVDVVEDTSSPANKAADDHLYWLTRPGRNHSAQIGLPSDALELAEKALSRVKAATPTE